MDPAFTLQLLSGDQDYFVIGFYACNRRVATTTEHYAAPSIHIEIAQALHGFPLSTTDERTVFLGAAEQGGDGARLRFYCLNSRGHCGVEIHTRHRYGAPLSVLETASLTLGFLPGDLDRFITDLAHLPTHSSIGLTVHDLSY